MKEGLKQLRNTSRPGLLALYRLAGVKPETIDMQTISFIIAPRLNASGRLEDAHISYRLLVTEFIEEAETLAEQLERLNQKRQQLTERAYAKAREEFVMLTQLPPILVVGDKEFTPGITGLVASKLVEEFYRPAVVMGLDEKIARASARSIPEFNLVEALHQCSDLFVRYGGHPQAAGFTIQPDNLPALKERLLRIAEDS